ncbi:MAG TPA: hypothetical protein VIK91_25285, partial [Nannocystis sp.]
MTAPSTPTRPVRRGLFARGLASLGLCSLALASAPARAQDPSRGGELIGDEGGGGPIPFNTCKKTPPGTKFTITLPKETELEDLVNWIMSITCQKFIWDRKVRSGKVTILSPEPVTADEAYAAFYAALETMG